MKFIAKTAAAVAVIVSALNLPVYARCPIDARLVVVNNLRGPGSVGVTLTGIGVIHRLGKDNRGGIQSFVFPKMTYMPELESDYKVLQSHAHGAPNDHWTVVVSYRMYGQSQDTVFTLWTHNLNSFADDLQAALQGATSNEIKAALATSTPSAGVAALVDPGIKLITALMVAKGPSLAGYEPRNLRCEDSYEISKKNITITIGGDAERDRNKVWIWTPTRGESYLGDLVPTLANPAAMMAEFEKKATGGATPAK